MVLNSAIGQSVNLHSNESPLVSICIPIYNGDKYILQTVESVLAQTYSNFELIINDDISTDNSLNICRNIKDTRVKVCSNSNNLGLIGNWKACINKAKGKYVKILCQDDLLYPDAIEKTVQVFEANPQVTVVTGSSNIINSVGKIVMKRQVYQRDSLLNGKQFAKKTFLRGRNLFAEPSVMMFRTDVAQNIDIFFDKDLIFGTDWDAGLLMAYKGDVFYLAEPVASFRISAESTSVKLHKAKDKISYEHLVNLFLKHQKIGEIKLSNFNFFTFKILVKMYTVARTIVQKYKD